MTGQEQLSKGVSLTPAPAYPSWPPSVAPSPHPKSPMLEFWAKPTATHNPAETDLRLQAFKMTHLTDA